MAAKMLVIHLWPFCTLPAVSSHFNFFETNQSYPSSLLLFGPGGSYCLPFHGKSHISTTTLPYLPIFLKKIVPAADYITLFPNGNFDH